MSGSQGGFGFGPTFGARPRVKVVKLAVCSMFVMVHDGDGWFPVCLASDGIQFARSLLGKRYDGAAIVVVDAAEVGR